MHTVTTNTDGTVTLKAEGLGYGVDYTFEVTEATYTGLLEHLHKTAKLVEQ